MAEKTMVTIDCDIIIPEEAEKTFENQHITLVAGIKCNGKLIFRNCEIEPITTQSDSKGKRRACKPGCIVLMNGTLEMEGCTISRPSNMVLTLFSSSVTIKDTDFCSVVPDTGSKLISGSGKLQLEGCSFVGEAEKNPQASDSALIKSDVAIITKCTFENITGRIEADTISGCSFTGCTTIESVDITDSTFTDCKSITANSGWFRNCDFIHIGDVSALSADVNNCRFQNIENDTEGEGVVFLEDSKIANCSFNGVDLRNNSYLIRGIGDSSVEDCQFTDCLTDREDLELCQIEQENSVQIGTKTSVPMGLLKGALKLAGSAALVATGAAATLAREAGSATGIDMLTDVAGMAQDASFEKIRDMWTPDEKKDEAYYEAQVKRSERRAEDAERRGSQFRKQYEKEKAKYEDME